MICENKWMTSTSKKISFHTADYDYFTRLFQITCHKTSVQVNITLFWDAAPWVCWLCTAAPKLPPWRWRHQLSGSAKSQPKEPQIPHPNIIPMKMITHLCGASHATSWRLTNNCIQTSHSLKFMECNCKGHATSDANRWSLRLRVWQHSQNKTACFAFAVFFYYSVNDAASYQRTMWGQCKIIW